MKKLIDLRLEKQKRFFKCMKISEKELCKKEKLSKKYLLLDNKF